MPHTNQNVINLPTPADRIVADFAREIRAIKTNPAEGIYLTGSISLNDFFPNKSDIDFLVLCRSLPDGKTAAALKGIHKRLAKKFQKPDLSGCYIALESLQTEIPQNIKVLSWHEGKLRFGTFEMAPVSLAELKSTALTVYGKLAETLPIQISQAMLNRFLLENINSYWTKWISNHASFFRRALLLLLFPRFTEWSVLGVARQLCTLQTGKIVSKTEAGLYCLEHLPEKFHPVLQEAIRIRKDDRTYPIVNTYAIRPSIKRMRQTVECVNFMIAFFNDCYAAH